MDDGVVRDMTVLRALSWNWASRTSVFNAYWVGTEVYNKFANVHVPANRFCNDYYQFMHCQGTYWHRRFFTHTFVHCSCCDMWKIVAPINHSRTIPTSKHAFWCSALLSPFILPWFGKRRSNMCHLFLLLQLVNLQWSSLFPFMRLSFSIWHHTTGDIEYGFKDWLAYVPRMSQYVCCVKYRVIPKRVIALIDGIDSFHTSQFKWDILIKTRFYRDGKLIAKGSIA